MEEEDDYVSSGESDEENSQTVSEDHEMDQNKEIEVRYLGPLTLSQRRAKVISYLSKKVNKANTRKHCYTCRKQVAEKRLRIKGRFVTKEQAF